MSTPDFAFLDDLEEQFRKDPAHFISFSDYERVCTLANEWPRATLGDGGYSVVSRSGLEVVARARNRIVVRVTGFVEDR